MLQGTREGLKRNGKGPAVGHFGSPQRKDFWLAADGETAGQKSFELDGQNNGDDVLERAGRWPHCLEFAIVAGLNFEPTCGVSLMNLHRGIMVAAASLLGLAGIGDLRAAEDRPASFDCTKDRSPLAVTVCDDRTATAAERRTTVNYLAVYYGLSDESRSGFRNDHLQWLNGLTTRCSLSPNLRQPGADQPTLSVECVRRAYALRGDLYRKKLSGAALEESNLPPAVLKKIQKRLIDLKFLSGNTDGVFGGDTRAAIKSYQASIGHAQGNFLTAQERNLLLAPNAMPAQTAPSKQTPAGMPEAAPGAAPAPRSTVGDFQNPDNRQSEPVATDRNVEQSAQQNPEAASPPAEADSAAPTDAGRELQLQYFIEGALLAAVILAFAAIFVFIRLRRRTNRATVDADLGPVVGASPGVALKSSSLRADRSAPGKSPRPAVVPKAHASAGSNPPHPAVRDPDQVNGTGAAVAGDTRRVQVDAPLAPERVVELHPQLEKGVKH